MKYTFGLIGSGNMGGAIAHAVSQYTKSGALADFNPEVAKAKAAALGFTAVSNEEAARESQYLFLGVKPHLMAGMLEGIRPVLAGREDDFVLVSMAAGLSIEQIQAMAGKDYPVIRIMPNTPACVGEGMIVYSVNSKVTEREKAQFEKAFSKAGEIEEIPEKLIDAASAVSGCGPAFVYMFIEALADGGVKCGLPRALAVKLAAKTVSGSGETVLSVGKHPGELKDAVCSPGGSTIEGVITLEDGAFRGTVSEAVTAAFERTKELGK